MHHDHDQQQQRLHLQMERLHSCVCDFHGAAGGLQLGMIGMLADAWLCVLRC